MNKNKGLLYASSGAICWGLSGVLSQFLFENYPVNSTWLTSIRMVFGGLILLLISYIKYKNFIFTIFKNKNDTLWLISFAIFGLLLCSFSFLQSIMHSNSATATVLQSLNVVFMSIFISIVHKKLISFKQLIAVILSIFGTILIVTKGKIDNIGLSNDGVIWGLLAAVGVVTYTLLSADIIKKYNNMTITGWGLLIGGIVLTLTTKSYYLVNVNLIGLIAIIAIVIIGTVAGFALFLQGVYYLGAPVATLIGCLEPASATLLSILILHTSFTLIEIIGFICIILTVVLSINIKE